MSSIDLVCLSVRLSLYLWVMLYDSSSFGHIVCVSSSSRILSAFQIYRVHKISIAWIYLDPMTL